MNESRTANTAPPASPLQRWVFAVGILAVALLSVRAVPEVQVSSDHYFYPRLAADLFRDHGSLGDWILISAPRFFPDMLLYFSSYLMFGGHVRSLQFASYLLIALQGAAVAWCAFRIDGRGCIATVAGLGYLAACIVLGDQSQTFAFVAWHSGTFAVIWFCAGLICGQWANWHLFAAALLAALVVASNFLAIPVLAAGMFGWWVMHLLLLRRFELRSLAPVLVVGAGCVLGMAVYYLLSPNPFSNPVDASDMSVGAAKDLPRLAGALFAGTFALGTRPIFLIAAALGVLAAAALPARSAARRALLELCAFWFVACVANELLISLGASEVDRYRIMPIFGSAAIAATGVAVLLGSFNAARWFPLLILAPMVAWGTDRSRQAIDHEYTRLTAEAQCLGAEVRRKRLDRGASDIYTANRYSVLSDGDLRLIGTRGNSAAISASMMSTAWLAQDPNYVVADREHDPSRYQSRQWEKPLSRQLALQHFGPPDEEHTCGRKVLMIYREGIALSIPKHFIEQFDILRDIDQGRRLRTASDR